jgi:DNA-binding response OmpR family regulator
MRLLLIEDSRSLQDSLETGLRRCGYAIDIAGDGPRGLVYAKHNDYDVIILDLMLPGLDGLSLLEQLRAAGRDTHVLILTACDTVADRVKGLRTGADDYLVKPFSFDELLARIEALTRRAYETKQPTIRVGDLAIDTASRTAKRGEESLTLTRREYGLLEFLAYRRGEVASRQEIEDHLYGEHNLPSSNAVDRIVCALRKKIDEGRDPPLLRTRRGFGYILDDPAP